MHSLVSLSQADIESRDIPLLMSPILGDQS